LQDRGGRELPSRVTVGHIIEALSGALFPMRLGPADLREESEDFYVGHTLDVALNALAGEVRRELSYAARHNGASGDDIACQAIEIVKGFAATLPKLRVLLDTDVLAAFQGDPAARSVDEVLICYPGVHAVIHHRLAHYFYQAGLPLLARMIAEIAHSATGIDIHPGAQIGKSFFIDHGTGVVIGETAIIGERVRIYQAVTLGAKRFPADEEGNLQKGQPRHPIVEDEVVIYAGATILGRITIGKGSTIGGNVWLTRSVPEGSNITQANLQNEVGV
jgi:serine O-acetyltransferase